MTEHGPLRPEATSVQFKLDSDIYRMFTLNNGERRGPMLQALPPRHPFNLSEYLECTRYYRPQFEADSRVRS